MEKEEKKMLTARIKEILNEIKAIHRGGGFGSIIDRNSFQRPKKEAIDLLERIMEIYKS